MGAWESFDNEVQNYSRLKFGHLLGQENDDRLSALPKEILMLIISNLTMSEVGRFGLVSRYYGLISRYVPVLIFEESQAVKEICPKGSTHPLRDWNNIVTEEIPRFVKRVNHVIEMHMGTSIDELQITCGLDHNWQSHVDKWATFALDKQVKRLEFNFRSMGRSIVINRNGVILPMCGDPPNLSPAFTGYKSSLSSLSLKYVNVTDDFVDSLFHGCPLLENLCIEGSNCLIRICGPLQVKRLEVSQCVNLKRINIHATKLQSFILHSCKSIELHIEDASSLSVMSINTRISKDCFGHVFASLSEYFSQLVCLSLWLPYLFHRTMRIDKDYLVAMPNLQHLEFQVLIGDNKSLEELTYVMAVCPSIQKLTLKLDLPGPRGRILKHDEPVEKWASFPLKCLKTLEIIGYVGRAMDLALAFFVLENANMLEEVIVTFSHKYEYPKSDDSDDKDKKERLVMLQAKLPQHVKLTVK